MTVLDEQRFINNTWRKHCDFLFEQARRTHRLVSDQAKRKKFQGRLTVFRGILKSKSPFDPNAWLGNFVSEYHSMSYSPPEEPPDPKTRLVCEYALVAAIHDEELEHLSIGKQLCNSDDKWKRKLWEGLLDVRTDGDCRNLQDRQNSIEIAFDDVEADLAEKPAEKEQNSIPAKIWALPCKLYEITLKVIVDAVLDRMWPK